MFEPTTLHRVLQLLPERLLRSAVRPHASDRYRKRFRTKAHLLLLLVAQLCGAYSLRDVKALLRRHHRRLHHAGGVATPRSTLSHANSTRDRWVFAEIAQGLMAQQERGTRRQAGQMMAALDSTP